MQRFLVIRASVTAALILIGTAAGADDINRTGQGQQTPGVESSIPSNPAQGDRPAYPGDQPAKKGTDPSSPVHNVDPRDLEGKKHRD